MAIRRLPTPQLLKDFRAYLYRRDGKTDGFNAWVTEQDFRDELATREHVPNKVEAKAIRRQKAQANHGNRKNKNR